VEVPKWYISNTVITSWLSPLVALAEAH